jgi:DNA-binding transcriptional MerR regulator
MKAGTFLKTAAIVVAVLLLLLGGAVVTLYLMFPPQKVIALVVPQIEKAIGRKVAVEKAGITLYPALGLSVSGISVSNTERQGFSREPFIRVGRFLASISVGSIFKGYPEIREITLKQPMVRIEVDKSGSFNFDDLTPLKKSAAQKPQAPQGMPALPVPITLKKLAIENGSIVYDDQKAGNQVIIESVNQEAAVAIDRQFKNITTTGKLVLSKVSVKTKEIKKPLSNLSITLSHDIGADLVGGSVRVNQVRLSLQKFFITVKGAVTRVLTPAPELDLAIVSDPMAVGDLLKEIPRELVPLAAKVTAAGSAEMGATVKGALVAGKPMPVRGELALRDVMVKYADLPQSINHCNAKISFTDNSIAINPMTMLFGTNPIGMQATVTDFKKPFVDATVKADVKLSEVKDVIKLPPGASLDGRIAGDIRARGEADPANPAKLDLKGSVDLKNIVVVWSPLVKPATINGRFTLSSKAIGQNVAVTVGQSSLTMAATVSNYLSFMLPDPKKKLPRTTADFKCTSPLLNIDEMIKLPEAAKEQGGANANAPILAPLPGIDMKGAVNAQKFIYRGYTMSNMVVKVTVKNDIADIDFVTGFGGGTIDNKLHANLKNVNNIVFTNDLAVKNVQINDLMGRFGEYLKPVTPLNRELAQINKCLFGRVNLQSSLAGNGGTADAIMKSVAGSVGAQMADGKIVNAPVTKAMGSAFAGFLKTDKLGSLDVINFRDLAAAVHLANGSALFDNLKLKSEIGDWSAKGSIGFDALMNMAVATRLSKAVSDKIVELENRLKGGLINQAQGKGTALAAVAGLLNQVNLVPRDNEGRVTLKVGLGGLVASPKISSLAFGEGTAGGTTEQQPATPQQQVQQEVKQQVEEKKQEVRQKVEQKKEEVKEEVTKKAAEKLKGLFKR